MRELTVPADLTFEVLRIIVVLNLGFAVGLAVSCVLFWLCCAVEQYRDVRRCRRRPLGTASVSAILSLIVPCALGAQSGRDVPEIEPTYIRIFGSDTLEIYGASLSPDGRWLMFSSGGLWVVPAGGGDPMRLVPEDYEADGALWFPTSDRVAFRAGPQGIMTVPIDSETGRPTGLPRPVTLEASSAYFDLSPDGKWIAYTPWADGQRLIRIVPSNGGTARTLVAADTPRPIWAPDGRHIYYHVRAGKQIALLRISVEGGDPDTVSTAGWIRLGHSSLLLSDGGDHRVFTVTSMTGKPLARFSLPGDMRPPGTTGLDSTNRFIATTSNFGAALHVLPVDGGPVRQLTDGLKEDAPIGWTESDRVLFSTQLNGKEVLLLSPAAGGAMHQVSLPEERRKQLNTNVPPPFLSRDGSHLFYEVPGDAYEYSVLKVLSLGDGSIHVITPAHLSERPGITGPGGIPHFNGPEFVYLEARGDRVDLRAWEPASGSRTLRTFGVDEHPGTMSLHDDRLVYARTLENRSSLRLERLGSPQSRELVSVSGGLQSAGWSPSGDYVAMVHVVEASGGWESARVAVQQVSPLGEPIGELRYVSDPSLSWWNVRWLPDSRGVLAAGWDDHNVWFFPVDPNASPVCLSQEEPQGVHEFVLSPDGRYIVYPSRVPRGSSVWLVDVGEIPGGLK
jgi:Tol biopolymer transport system component